MSATPLNPIHPIDPPSLLPSTWAKESSLEQNKGMTQGVCCFLLNDKIEGRGHMQTRMSSIGVQVIKRQSFSWSLLGFLAPRKFWASSVARYLGIDPSCQVDGRSQCID